MIILKKKNISQIVVLMHSFILLSVIFFGKVISLDGYSPNDICVPIGNNTIGRINCEHAKHIHIENMWLDQRACIIEPSTTSSIVTQITDIKCQGTSNCTVPFKSDAYRYFNIWFQCTDCKSVSQGKRLSISCPHNTRIRIQDVWRDGWSYCPAYRFARKTNFAYADYKRRCDGKHTCQISSNGQQSIYFYCEGLSTTKSVNAFTTATTLYTNSKTVPSVITRTTSLFSTFIPRVVSLVTSFQPATLPVSNSACPICLEEERCKTIREDSTTSISCGNDDILYISKAWIDKSFCKRAKIIPRNAINKTMDIFSICNGTSKCDIPYYTGKNGENQLNIIYKCKAPVGSRVEDQIKKQNTGGATAGGIVAGFLLICLAVGVLLYRRRNNDHTKSQRKQFVTRSNPAYESDIDVGTVDNSNQNMETSLYHQYFEVVHDQDFDRARHNYVNTSTVTYDYASEIGPIEDDTYDNTKQGVGGKQQSEDIDSNTYSHLQDTLNDSNDNTYDHASHNRVPVTPENDYSVSRCQMSEDDYDVSGNHYRANHIDGSENVYN